MHATLLLNFGHIVRASEGLALVTTGNAQYADGSFAVGVHIRRWRPSAYGRRRSHSAVGVRPHTPTALPSAYECNFFNFFEFFEFFFYFEISNSATY